MDPTVSTGDYQNSALYGSAPNNSTLTADMLNPAASGPNDWQAILTNGIAGAAVNGINGAVNNAVQAGALQNAITANNNGLYSPPVVVGNDGLLPLLLIGALLYALAK